MKKSTIILVCMLACLSMFTGCTNQKGNNHQDANVGNSIEIDDADLEIDTDRKPGTEKDSNTVDLSDGFTYSFKDPDNADGIVVTPKE